jgi:hypothetical protein
MFDSFTPLEDNLQYEVSQNSDKLMDNSYLQEKNEEEHSDTKLNLFSQDVSLVQEKLLENSDDNSFEDVTKFRWINNLNDISALSDSQSKGSPP